MTVKVWIAVGIALIILGGWGGYKLWQMWNGSLNRPEDKISVAYDLDGLASIKVPQSFEQNKQYLLTNFYYLEPVQDKFTYSFYLKRAEFIDLGGNHQTPVILALSIYNPQTPFDDWTNYIERFQDGSFQEQWSSDSIPSATDLGSSQVLEEDDNSQLGKLQFTSETDGNPRVTLLVYTYQNQNEKYRLGLSYWDSYLTDEAASKLLDDTISTIVIKDTLSSRLQAIEDEFYKEFPEKKP